MIYGLNQIGKWESILQQWPAMPVNSANYNHRGGGNFGIVLRCPLIVGPDRLVYFDHNKDRGTWVIRDFISWQRLDNLHSSLSVDQIEQDATYDEFPIWCNAEENPEDWRTYLTFRTTAVLRLKQPPRSLVAPNPRSGEWMPIS